MENIDILNFASDTGKLLLSNGAETYRVEDTVSRIISSFGIDNYDIFATSTGIFISIDNHTTMKRVKKRNLNIRNIIYINDISRKIVTKNITILDAKSKLNNIINNADGYPTYVYILSIGVACFFIALLYKGTLADALTTFIVATLSCCITVFLESKNAKSLLVTTINGIFIALLSLIFINIHMGDDVDAIIISSVMPLLPGVCFTNAIRDIFEGDYISGGSRLLEALVIGSGLAIGVGIVLSIWLNIFGDFLIGV